MNNNLTPRQTAILHAILTFALSNLGVAESPVGSNWGLKVRMFLASVGILRPAAWCCAFACWCLKKAGAIPGIITSTGYVPALVGEATRRGTLIKAGDVAAGQADVYPGYLVAFWETFPDPKLNGWHHVGILKEAPDADGHYTTVEGNSNTSGSREGYEVVLQHRNIHLHSADGHVRCCFIRTVA